MFTIISTTLRSPGLGAGTSLPLGITGRVIGLRVTGGSTLTSLSLSVLDASGNPVSITNPTVGQLYYLNTGVLPDVFLKSTSAVSGLYWADVDVLVEE